MRRTLVVLALVVSARDASAGDEADDDPDAEQPASAPSDQVQLKVAVAIEQATAKQWTEALATLDAVVQTAPEWAEGYFLRAGVRVQLAGDESSLESLQTTSTSTDYQNVLDLLERASLDLETYLQKAPKADNKQQVMAAIGALRTRITAAKKQLDIRAKQRREELEAVAVAEDAATDEYAQPLAMRDLTRARHLALELGVAQLDVTGQSSPAIGTLVASTHWTLRHAVTLGAEVPLGVVSNNDPDNGVRFGNVAVGAGVLRDVRKKRAHIRLALSGQLGLGSTTSAGGEAFLALDQGIANPVRWVENPGFDIVASVRVARGDAFLQLDGGGGYIYPGDISLAHRRVSLGGGVKLSRRMLGLATFTVAGGDPMLPWTGDRTIAELRVGLAGKRLRMTVVVPLNQPAAASRSVGAMMSLTIPLHGDAKPETPSQPVDAPAAPDASPDGGEMGGEPAPESEGGELAPDTIME